MRMSHWSSHVCSSDLHPHSHILIRGITEDGKTLNIAGDYIAHAIRYRASEIMTRALGPQSEIEVRPQLALEVDAERLTDRTSVVSGKSVSVCGDIGGRRRIKKKTRHRRRNRCD